ncbi:hypothetical protein ASG31_07715 [Chryseobacterium sp. Leaf404]|uniref:hypothetical protein n=1 Tax=unclassified Chryseobacterium TaxID=2593645 RepID=UPI0006F5C9FD|nr:MULTISPECIES: hypothetical protein [unclassified Chryseobacterium]KQT18592.1 hypothetical protein ASG31_07715 [Chryseobacterium sp. Leaf404]
MRFQIFKLEAIFQSLITLGGLIYNLNFYHSYKDTDFLSSLLLFGLANVMGFLIRISLVKSTLNHYYFYGVVLFFLILFALIKLCETGDFEMHFMQVGGFV